MVKIHQIPALKTSATWRSSFCNIPYSWFVRNNLYESCVCLKCVKHIDIEVATVCEPPPPPQHDWVSVSSHKPRGNRYWLRYPCSPCNGITRTQIRREIRLCTRAKTQRKSIRKTSRHTGYPMGLVKSLKPLNTQLWTHMRNCIWADAYLCFAYWTTSLVLVNHELKYLRLSKDTPSHIQMINPNLPSRQCTFTRLNLQKDLSFTQIYMDAIAHDDKPLECKQSRSRDPHELWDRVVVTAVSKRVPLFLRFVKYSINNHVLTNHPNTKFGHPHTLWGISFYCLCHTHLWTTSQVEYHHVNTWTAVNEYVEWRRKCALEKMTVMLFMTMMMSKGDDGSNETASWGGGGGGGVMMIFTVMIPRNTRSMEWRKFIQYEVPLKTMKISHNMTQRGSATWRL